MKIPKLVMMHRHNTPFQWILKGTKRVEGRINDSKRKSICVDDYLIVKNRENKQQVLVRVIAKREYASFEELASKEALSKLGSVKTKQGYLDEVFKYYTKDEENKSGVVAIEISDPLAITE